MNMLLKCKIQNLAILFSFLLGIFLTLTVTNFENKCNLEFDNTNYYDSLKKIHPGTYDLIILIISNPTNGDRRQAIRETWLQLQDKIQYDAELNNFRMKYYFIVGSMNLITDTVLHLSTEQSVNNDLLFLNIKDEYSTLTQKVLNSFVWLNEQLNNKNFDYNFVLKCDDDTFVQLDHLAKEILQIRKQYLFNLNYLDNIQKFRFNSYNLIKNNVKNMQPQQLQQPKHLYWGYFSGNAKIKIAGKWKETEWIYCDRYIPYALGGGYILSKGLVTYIAKNANYLKLLNSEDVSVGLWLAPVDNIERKHDSRFDTEWTSRGCKNTFIVTHKHTIEEMRMFYRNLAKNGRLCKKEFLKRSSYNYNWSVVPSQCCQDIESVP